MPPSAAAALAAAKSWGYQLQRIKPETLAAIPYDLFVLDYSRDGTDARALTAEEVAALKTKPDGSRRVVLAYLSIGEAENYRYYWQPDWETASLAPSWLAPANKKWRTNFPVRYWDADWQAIMFAGENSYLARIVAAGFDGVYLDRIDAFQEFESENPAARDEMIAFVSVARRACAHAQAGLPGGAAERRGTAGRRRLSRHDRRHRQGGPVVRRRPAEASEQARPHCRYASVTSSTCAATASRCSSWNTSTSPRTSPAPGTRIEQLGFIPHFAIRRLDTMREGDLPPPKTGKN